MTNTNILNSYPPPVEKLPFLGKEAILKTLGYLSLSTEEYFVIGGANMVLRDIKLETPDLDMLVSEDAFDWLKKRRGAKILEPPLRAKLNGADNNTVWVKNARTPIPVGATTRLGDGYYPMSFDSHRNQTELVDGVPCLQLEHVKAAKEALQRPKDIADLEAIAHFLGEEFEDLPEPTIKNPFPESS